MSISGDPLDEIAVAPSFISGCSIYEILLLLVASLLESIWVSIWVSRLSDFTSIIVFPFGVIYFFVRFVPRFKHLGRLKKDLPPGQYSIYLLREMSRHTNMKFIVTIIMIIFVSHIFSVTIFSLFGYMPLGFLIGSYLSVVLIKKGYNKIPSMTPSKFPQSSARIISKTTLFNTSRFH
ncbi:hypothetical protein [Aliivibrio fischeri]|uniref:hypothetical protein n=1 Tax=Aliivibrio fischeri TaxID=668 RepID=UPI0007C4E315|nr:hypothetical protein [Aliivibrio fischeri]